MNIFNRISFLDKLLFTKHLSIMIKSGIIISEALSTLIEQTKSKPFRLVLSAVLSDIQNGQSLAKALGKHPRIFDQFFISLIEVGEESGTLEENLEFLSKQLAKDFAMRKKVQGAMMYPSIVFFAVTIMGGFISLFLLPQLVDFFGSFQIELPLPTKILMFVANIMKSHGILIVSSGAAFFALGSFIVHTKAVKPTWHRILLRVPIFGKFLISVNLARFSRNLGTMLTSGVPLIRCLQITGHTLDNVQFQRMLFDAQENVRRGKQLAKSLDGGNLMPPLVIKMIAIGEKSGKLEEVLLYLADFYDDEIDEFSRNLSTILEPIMLIGIGLVVGFVAIAIIGPIYELTGALH